MNGYERERTFSLLMFCSLVGAAAIHSVPMLTVEAMVVLVQRSN